MIRLTPCWAQNWMRVPVRLPMRSASSERISHVITTATAMKPRVSSACAGCRGGADEGDAEQVRALNGSRGGSAGRGVFSGIQKSADALLHARST